MIDVLIVGSGISGLTAAVQCQADKLDIRVVEAKDRIGGRVQSAVHKDSYVGDLGPSWVWPPWQPVASRWLSELGLDTFSQHEEGLGLVELPDRVEKHPLPGQHGIARLRDGPQAIVTALAARLGAGVIQCNAMVRKLVLQSDYIEAHVRHGHLDANTDATANGTDIICARQVVLATPLRTTLEQVRFEPALPSGVCTHMAETPTWMAAQVKVVASYNTPFWRDDGLSGRVASRAGPLVEIHDHCGQHGDPAALFGFMGLDFRQRQEHRDHLPRLVLDQLARCFGSQAATPVNLWIEDWALVNTICAEADRSGPAQHPEVRPDSLRQGLMNGRLHFAVAEVATESPGLIEGALQAGEMAAASVLGTHQF